jgi:glycosyltransferase involved in cell wall biosynthesis
MPSAIVAAGKRLTHGLLLALTRLALCLMPAARHNRPVRRSLWSGAPILNMAVNARAEALLGVQADSLVFGSYFITDRFTYNLRRWSRAPLLRTVLPYAVFLWACRRYQRFHFYCNRGLLGPASPGEFRPEELQILRQLGKEVFFWTYGADVRTRDATLRLGEPNCCTHCPAPGRACACDDRRGRANLARIAAAATAVLAMGDMTEYTPGSRNDLFFWPVDLEADAGRKYAPCYPAAAGDGPLLIVHAPNHRHFKGTEYLLAAVERLRAEGRRIKLVLVENVPNDEALKVYRTADLVFDQCLIGFHGYFALEAMAMGKPVVCFIRRPREYLLAAEECPLVNAGPQELEATLRELAGDRRRLHDLGRQGRRYVEKHFTLAAFAERLERLCPNLGPDGKSPSPQVPKSPNPQIPKSPNP